MAKERKKTRKKILRELKAGKEWWGKRPLSGTEVSRKNGMKFWKRLLHKKERQEGKEQCDND